MAKRKLIKHTNDFIIGMVLLGLGIFVVSYKDIVHGFIPANLPGGYLTRPDVYVRLIGAFLSFLAAILVIRSINFQGTTDTKGFRFVISKEVVFSFLSLIIYTALLTRIGFFASTFLFAFFLACIYLRKEKFGPGKPPMTRKEILRNLVTIFVYSVLLILAVYIIFTRALYVALP
jgi:hypothetical protein